MTTKSDKTIMKNVELLLAKQPKPLKVKTGLYLDASLKIKLEELAIENESSFNNLVTAILADWVEKNSKG